MSPSLLSRLSRFSVVLALVAAVVACKSSSGTDPDDPDGPPQVNSVCRSVPAVHITPLCDGCTRDLCCPEVLACEGSEKCKAFIHCQAACAKTDKECNAKCRAETGGVEPGEFPPINSCATKNCPVACAGG